MFNYIKIMKSQIVLLTIACGIAAAGCSSTQAQSTSESTATTEIASVEAKNTDSSQLDNSTETLSNSPIAAKAGYQCQGNKNHLFLGNGTKKNNYGNPIYTLHLCVDGKNKKSFEIVTGRSFTQTKNRHQSGNHSPLPNGKYTISSGLTQGTLAEVGRVDGLNVSKPFLPISPLFRTGRSALGIHVDPSYNIDRKEDGTSGCIGMLNQADFKSLWADIRHYQVRDLQVTINTRAIDNPDVANQK
jgi:hypothetical protein